MKTDWLEVRSWIALSVSMVALLVSVGSYLRGERHRLQALREADLRAFEDYHRALVGYLRDVDNHRGVLASVARDASPGGYPDFEGVESLRQASPHWPLIPGRQTDLSIKAFNACQEALGEVLVFEEVIRARAPPVMYQGAHQTAHKAIAAGDAALNALAISLIEDRAKLRNPRWWPRLSKLLFRGKTAKRKTKGVLKIK
jgi:hypothetical protein